MRFKTEKFRAEDLVLDTRPHYRYGCPGCYRKLELDKDDPRVGSGMAPRCDRCGEFMCAIDVESDPAN